MRQSNRYLILAGAFVSCLSCIYFFSLFLPVPFVVTIVILLAALYFLHRWIVVDKEVDARLMPGNNVKEWISLVWLGVGIAIIAANLYYFAPKYGGWDASAIWNFNAQYLVDPDNWRKLFQNVEYSHSDYPLCMPAVIAFFMRALSTDSTIAIPFALSLSVSLTIPVLIYQEVSRKNIVVAMAVLVLFIVEQFYITTGVSQYADILVAFFFLCAFICMNYAGQDKKYLALCAFFLASCAWTKNEGGVLAAIFILFYAPLFFSKKNIRYTAMGLILPLSSLLIFKMVCSTQNDLVSEANAGMVGFLLLRERYAAIFKSYLDLSHTSFAFTSIAICIFIAFSVMMKKAPGRQLYILLTCLVAYSMVYVVTPKNLAWHLETSHSRLLLQLMPALIYVMANSISEMQLVVPEWINAKKVA